MVTKTFVKTKNIGFKTPKIPMVKRNQVVIMTTGVVMVTTREGNDAAKASNWRCCTGCK